MTQRIVVHGDSVTTPLTVGKILLAKVEVEGGIELTGTGHATIDGKKVCLAEAVKNKRYKYSYTKEGFKLAGDGTVLIEAVAADHIHSADKVKVSDGKVKLFFTPGMPASNPQPVEPPEDGDPPSGSHEFDLKMSNEFVNSIKE